MVTPLDAGLAAAAVLAVVLSVPFGVTAMGYRRRDNGLAYLLLVSGTAVWNGMFAVQLVGPDPQVKAFFLALTVVGSLIAGLGWFLFASTASRTVGSLDRPGVYAVVAIVAGLDIVLAVTTPAHSVYWVLPTAPDAATSFAVVEPRIGYWLHNGFLASLFAAGTALFAGAWDARREDRYPRAYTLVGVATVLAILGSAVLRPGGVSVAPAVATGLVVIGWVQAKRGRVLESVRRRLRPE